MGDTKNQQKTLPREAEVAEPYPNILRAISISHFRRFENLEIESLPVGPLIIMGQNGSGKTSLLWAILLLLCSYNSKCESSSDAKEERLELNGESIASLMNYPGLLHCSFVQTFIRTGDCATITAKFDNNVDLCCTIKANGVIYLITEKPWPTKTEKIQFAYMGSSTSFISPAKEVNLAENQIFTSSVHNIRNRFWVLTDNNRYKIFQVLESFFAIKSIQSRDGDRISVFLIEADDTKIEIIQAGDALRKIFTAFVLYYTLVECTEKRKIYLIEEPEVLLYPSLQKLFLDHICRIASSDNIQMITASNSHKVLDCFPHFNILALMNKEITVNENRRYHVSYHSSSTKYAIKAIDHLLDIHDKKPLLICEGDDDVKFIQKLAKLLKIDPTKVQIHPSGRFCDTDKIKFIAESIHKVYTDLTIRCIADRDFYLIPSGQEVVTLKNAKTKLYFWGLPCIESYIFVYHCEKNKDKDPLAFFRTEENRKIFSAKYCNGFLTKNKPDSIDTNDQAPNHDLHDRMFAAWTNASIAATNVKPSSGDIRAVAEVLHGHTWTDIIRKTAPELIEELAEDVHLYCPDLKKLLGTLLQG